MNIYFLVEGKTEKKVYPLWLSYMAPGLKQVKNFHEVDTGNYFIFSSGGYPSIFDDIPNAVKDINECGKYDFLVVCMDADEMTVEERKDEIEQLFHQKSLELKAQLVIIVQNRCFETWCLGNRKVFSRNPQDETFKQYCKFYNVSEKDPESMPQFPGFGSIAQFHIDYLKRMLREKGLTYSKALPGKVGESHYVEALIKRIEDTSSDLKSLREFFSFCEKIPE